MSTPKAQKALDETTDEMTAGMTGDLMIIIEDEDMMMIVDVEVQEETETEGMLSAQSTFIPMEYSFIFMNITDR